jgi:hypothetical protein
MRISNVEGLMIFTLMTLARHLLGSYLMAVDVMLCYVHVAYVYMRRPTLLVWYSHAPFWDLISCLKHHSFQSVVAPSSIVQTV